MKRLLKPEFFRERTQAMLARLAEAIDSREGLVSETSDLIENQVPPGCQRGSLEHAQFLFAVVPSDRGVKSSSLWERAARLFESDRWFFDPKSYRGGANVEALTDQVYDVVLNRLKPRYARPAADGVIRNAHRLFTEFESDPRAVFSADKPGAESYKAIRSFVGFGPKTGGMMYRAAVGLGWASARDSNGIEIPVDTHDVRIAWQLGVFRLAHTLTADMHQSLAPAVRRELTAACNDLQIQWFDVDRAMWLIGSRGCARKRCTFCPLRGECSVGQLVVEATAQVGIGLDVQHWDDGNPSLELTSFGR